MLSQHFVPNNHSLSPTMNCPLGDMVHYDLNANVLGFFVSVSAVVYE